jgi:hypothetical protein
MPAADRLMIPSRTLARPMVLAAAAGYLTDADWAEDR